MNNLVDAFTHEYTYNGDAYKFVSNIRKESRTSGGICFEITMRIYDLEPYLHKWIDEEGTEREYIKHSYYERIVDSFYNLPEAKKFVKDNLQNFINNHISDSRWEEQY